MYLIIFVVLILLFCGVSVAFNFIWVPFVFSHSSISSLFIWQFSPPTMPQSASVSLFCSQCQLLRPFHVGCGICCTELTLTWTVLDVVLETPAPCHFKTCISHLERDISEECVVSTKLLSSPYGCKLVS